MNTVSLVGLVRIELPDRTLRFSSGGFIQFDGETYEATDPVYGTIGSVRALSEGIGDTIPALVIDILPAQTSLSVNGLSVGAIQQSSVKLWVAEYNQETGVIIGTPELRFIGAVDQPQVTFALGQFTIQITCVPELELLFFRDDGNGLSTTFHKSIYGPGELGHDNATGLSRPIYWGVQSPPRTGVVFGGSGGGGGGGGGSGFETDRR